MKIEIWSDYVCPFCYMGKKAFDEALSKFPEKEKIDVEFKSFQLEPDTPPYTGQDFYESMAYKFGGVEKTKKMMADVAKQAKERGLDYHFDTMKPANTFDAHRLMKFARAHDKDYDVYEKIFFANLTKSKDIRNSELLAELAERSEEHTSELQSRGHLVCRLLLEKKKKKRKKETIRYKIA